MEWYNEPPEWSHENNILRVMTPGKTDYWRITLHNFIKDDAPFFFQPVTGNFTATVKVTGDYVSLYDQAGLMVRESPTVWMKCGIEFVEGIQYASAVITREFSDWSIVPLEDNPSSIWIRVKRIDSAIEVYFSRDNQVYTLIRQAYLSANLTLQIGRMCAAPQGEGFRVTFEDFSLE